MVRISSELAPVPSLLSNIYRLSRDCGFICLKHIPISLVAGLKTISPLSSSSLSPVLKFLFSSSPGLYSWSSSSYSKYPSSIPFPCLLLHLVSNQVLYQVLYISHVLLTIFCFFNSTLNPFSLILMIILMTMRLCCFPGFCHILVTYLFYIHSSYCLLSRICALFSGHPLCTSE